MSLIGRPPIPLVPFLAAKAALVPPYVCLAWGALYWTQDRLAWPAAAPLAAIMVVAGLAVAGIAMVHLGPSLHVGLPEGPTTFRQGGVYRFSRNPIYAGLFLSMAGSCLLVPHWLNIGSTLVAIGLHHLIVLAEERFLEQRFGDAWRAYRAAVRRYA